MIQCDLKSYRAVAQIRTHRISYINMWIVWQTSYCRIQIYEVSNLFVYAHVGVYLLNQCRLARPSHSCTPAEQMVLLSHGRETTQTIAND